MKAFALSILMAGALAGASPVCADAASHNLERLHTRLFDAFPRLPDIRAERATASGQGAAILKPATPALSW